MNKIIHIRGRQVILLVEFTEVKIIYSANQIAQNTWVSYDEELESFILLIFITQTRLCNMQRHLKAVKMKNRCKK